MLSEARLPLMPQRNWSCIGKAAAMWAIGYDSSVVWGRGGPFRGLPVDEGLDADEDLNRRRSSGENRPLLEISSSLHAM
jgi:hypothetical protein